jgi:hypothetical protein
MGFGIMAAVAALVSVVPISAGSSSLAAVIVLAGDDVAKRGVMSLAGRTVSETPLQNEVHLFVSNVRDEKGGWDLDRLPRRDRQPRKGGRLASVWERVSTHIFWPSRHCAGVFYPQRYAGLRLHRQSCGGTVPNVGIINADLVRLRELVGRPFKICAADCKPRSVVCDQAFTGNIGLLSDPLGLLVRAPGLLVQGIRLSGHLVQLIALNVSLPLGLLGESRKSGDGFRHLALIGADLATSNGYAERGEGDQQGKPLVDRQALEKTAYSALALLIGTFGGALLIGFLGGRDVGLIGSDRMRAGVLAAVLLGLVWLLLSHWHGW